jgi:hypothetical protein
MPMNATSIDSGMDTGDDEAAAQVAEQQQQHEHDEQAAFEARFLATVWIVDRTSSVRS